MKNLISITVIVIVTALISISALNGEPRNQAGSDHNHDHDGERMTARHDDDERKHEHKDDKKEDHDHEHEGGDHDERNDHDKGSTGSHGGRLLSADSFAIEIVIAESGLPPEFRVYGYEHGRPLDPDAFSVHIHLTRLGGQVDEFSFASVGDYLRGDGVVREPHSFDVEVIAEYGGNTYDWDYESHEGRTMIPDQVAAESGVGVASAGPAVVVDNVELTGTVQALPSGISEVRARFPGLVTKIFRDIGDEVRAGDVLAIVESNESLRDYEVKAPISGLIVARDLQVGQVAADQPLYQIVDLLNVWVQLDAIGLSAAQVAAGQKVRIVTLDGHEVDGTIEYLSPLVAHGSQSQRARVPLPNPDRRIRPGQFVRGSVTVASSEVPLAVRTSALQTFRDFDVVYEKIGTTYEVRMVTLGRRDNEHVEVLDGLSPGAVYVSENSYLIKADIEKSGATHQH